jgi:hypothetical protein
MGFDVFDARNRATQRLTEDDHGAPAQGSLPGETGIAKPPRTGARELSPRIGGPECVYCRHRHCSVCDECSAAKQFSDYWICHCCRELNRRGPTLF